MPGPPRASFFAPRPQHRDDRPVPPTSARADGVLQLIDRHFDAYARVHSERFAFRHGPLRTVVRSAVEQYRDCGRYESGFARLRCPTCRGEHLIAFSCQTRNFCPSCQAKRAAILGAFLAETILLPVPHRHMVFTVPKVLRGLFERERALLGLMSRAAFESVRRCFQEVLQRPDAVPGMVASIQTFGSYGNWHPHVHAIVTDGLIARGGVHVPLAMIDARVLEERFRRTLLRSLHRAERLRADTLEKLLAWQHSGFSVHVGEVIESSAPERLERLGRYIKRAPVAMARVHPQKDGRIKLLTPPDPKTGADSQIFDPLAWVHAVTTQIPDPYQHLVRYYGAYANRSRRLYRPSKEQGEAAAESGTEAAAEGAGRAGGKAGSTEAQEDEAPADTSTQPGRRAWARLLRRIYEVDPLTCPTCQVEMKIVAVVTDREVVDHILRHRTQRKLQSPFASRAPPAA